MDKTAWQYLATARRTFGKPLDYLVLDFGWIADAGLKHDGFPAQKVSPD
jgi:hypothetical protein